ncbi:MAG: 30S ribosome-binding factor RbfA [Coriobacteriales bacterium]|jgi:ribosome-binding factor A|nr:30S ribosome-binding factor RbfA [Coriobacteriales bacterium]
MKQTAASRKINEVARAALANILLMEVSDPRLDFVTITHVEVSKDRSVANVFVTASAERYEEVLAGLNSAKGRLRTLLGHELGWRVSPALRFFVDEGIDFAQQITSVIHDRGHLENDD